MRATCAGHTASTSSVLKLGLVTGHVVCGPSQDPIFVSNPQSYTKHVSSSYGRGALSRCEWQHSWRPETRNPGPSKHFGDFGITKSLGHKFLHETNTGDRPFAGEEQPTL